MNEKKSLRKSNIWIFQANPKRYKIREALDDYNISKNHWLVNQYGELISKGDLCLIWMSGKEGGIYAVGEIASNPERLTDSEAESKYWISDGDKEIKRLRVKFVYKMKLVDYPLLRQEIKDIPELKNLSILKQPQGTNFPVTEKEWNIISELIKNKNREKINE